MMLYVSHIHFINVSSALVVLWLGEEGREGAGHCAFMIPTVLKDP